MQPGSIRSLLSIGACLGMCAACGTSPVTYSAPVGLTLKAKSKRLELGRIIAEQAIGMEAGNPYGAFIADATARFGHDPSVIRVEHAELVLGATSKGVSRLDEVLSGDLAGLQRGQPERCGHLQALHEGPLVRRHAVRHELHPLPRPDRGRPAARVQRHDRVPRRQHELRERRGVPGQHVLRRRQPVLRRRDPLARAARYSVAENIRVSCRSTLMFPLFPLP